MVANPDYLIELTSNYAAELERPGVPVREIILFGSYARGEEGIPIST